MQQTVASTFTTELTGGLGLQVEVNLKGFRVLNDYCHLIQPINSSSHFQSTSRDSSYGDSGLLYETSKVKSGLYSNNHLNKESADGSFKDHEAALESNSNANHHANIRSQNSNSSSKFVNGLNNIELNSPRNVYRPDLSELERTLDINQVHPLVLNVYNSIINYKSSAKNIELLVEVERICLFLNGCKVTFCKSGKLFISTCTISLRIRYL